MILWLESTLFVLYNIYIRCIFPIMVALGLCDFKCLITKVKPDHGVWTQVNIKPLNSYFVFRITEPIKLISDLPKQFEINWLNSSVPSQNVGMSKKR